jgi:hypothetical protein
LQLQSDGWSRSYKHSYLEYLNLFDAFLNEI